jgi:hypothetical protein
MKNLTYSLFAFQLIIGFSMFAQEQDVVPDLSSVNDPDLWTLHNREIIDGEVVHLNGQAGDGLLWLKDAVFDNAKIAVDIKGVDQQGRSFVGIAFHILDENTYDAVYFRPFNFRSPERNGHSVQYISHPEYTWSKLREEHPGKYENLVDPVPDPTDWFHATIVVAYPEVKVFVDRSEEPSLIIEQLSTRKQGTIGFWVGNGSEGWFRNLKIIPE